MDAIEPTGAPTPRPAPAAISPRDDALVQLATAYLADRRSERRWRNAFRIVLLLVLGALAWEAYTARLHAGTEGGPHTALIDIRGEIADDTDASAEHLIGALRSAFEEEDAVAIVLRINSPGGSPVQAGIVNDEIQRLKGLHHKKVYAVIEEECASGAYYIAAAADEIYTDKASIVGSIGVLMDSFGYTGLMNKLGVERRLLTAGENKGIGDPYSPMSEQQRAYLKSTLTQIHHQFIEVVRRGRGNRLKETPEIFSGLFWNGEEAIRLGLADKLGSLDSVARDVIKEEEIVDYTPHDNVAERLAKRFGAAVGAGAVRAAGGSLRLR